MVDDLLGEKWLFSDSANEWSRFADSPFIAGSVFHPNMPGTPVVEANWQVPAREFPPGLLVFRGGYSLGLVGWAGESEFEICVEQAELFVSRSYRVWSQGETAIGISFLSDGSPFTLSMRLKLNDADHFAGSVISVSPLAVMQPITDTRPLLYDLTGASNARLSDGDAPRLLSANQGGLINRLIPMLSTIHIAENSGRRPYVWWARNQHCAAAFSDLFALGKYSAMPEEPCFLAPSVEIFDNYRDEALNLDLNSNVHNTIIHSVVPISTVPELPHRHKHLRPIFERLRYSVAIRRMLEPFDGIDFSSVIGFHIRRPYPGAAFAELEQSKFTLGLDLFIELIRDLKKAYPQFNKILVCTNDMSAEEELKQKLGNSIMTFSKTSIDNTTNPVAVQEALVDLTLMSRCPLLFSQESTSFGHFAHVLGQNKLYCVTKNTDAEAYDFWRFEEGRHSASLKVTRGSTASSELALLL